MSEYEYDLIVIGSGPGGQKAAIAAAKLGKKVAVVLCGRNVTLETFLRAVAV